MISASAINEDSLIEEALRRASDTRLLIARGGVRHETAAHFALQFGHRPAMIVADANTFRAAGKDVAESFARAGHATSPAFLFGQQVYANEECVRELESVLATTPAIPVAVGSGAINDLTK